MLAIYDLIEANEAFAAQAIAVNREMGWDVAKVNVNGGAVALGHLPHRHFGCPRSCRAAARNAKARREEGPDDPLHRRRHGRCYVHREVREPMPVVHIDILKRPVAAKRKAARAVTDAIVSSLGVAPGQFGSSSMKCRRRIMPWPVHCMGMTIKNTTERNTEDIEGKVHSTEDRRKLALQL